MDPKPLQTESQGPEPLQLPAGRHQLCSCGRSRHGWFCNGAHLGSGRVSHELVLPKAETVMMCGCGHSRRYPLCDGSHAARTRQGRRWWSRLLTLGRRRPS